MPVQQRRRCRQGHLFGKALHAAEFEARVCDRYLVRRVTASVRVGAWAEGRREGMDVGWPATPASGRSAIRHP